MEALGRHLLAEFTGCDPERLADLEHIQASMLAAAEASGATVVGHNFHPFSPWGVSGVVIISESHLAIHTWPEHSYAAVDLFTCGGDVDPWLAYEVLREALGAEHGSAVALERGLLPNHGAAPLGMQRVTERRG